MLAAAMVSSGGRCVTVFSLSLPSMGARSQWKWALPGLLWLWGVCLGGMNANAQTLTGVSVSPSSVIGGLQTNLSVTLSAPAPAATTVPSS